MLIQPLPFAKEKTVSNVLQKIYTNKKTLSYSSFSEVESSFSLIFSDWEYLEEISIENSCSCSKEMFIGALFSLSEDEIKNIILEKETLNASCSLCGKEYTFSHEDIASYYN